MAIQNVNTIIRKKLLGNQSSDIYEIDKLMLELDNTENKSNLGANAMLGVSLCCMKAFAKSNKMEIYEYISQISGNSSYSMPVPMMNILNGGSHADNNVDIQEFMIYPSGLSSFSEALQSGCEIFNKLKTVLKKKNYNTAVGDEGGFAPNLRSNQEALDLISESVVQAGYKLGLSLIHI